MQNEGNWEVRAGTVDIKNKIFTVFRDHLLAEVAGLDIVDKMHFVVWADDYFPGFKCQDWILAEEFSELLRARVFGE